MKLDQFCQTLYSLTNIPISIFSKHNDLVQTFERFHAPLEMENRIRETRVTLSNKINRETVTQLTDTFNFSYFAFASKQIHFVFGPFLVQEITETTKNTLKQEMKFIGEVGIMFDNMLHELKILSPSEIEFIYNIVTKMFQKEYAKIDFTHINSTPKKITDSEFSDSLNSNLEYVRKNYKTEDKFIHIIETGDVKKASFFSVEDIMTSLPERALNDTLRNTKTKLTILNTLCNRAAIRGGISVQQGHQISTNFGINIEKMKSVFDYASLQKEIIVSYTNAVHNFSLNNYSKLVKEAILLIRRNITTNYNLNQLALDLFITKEHLSRQFKKETGFTVSNYIKKVKIIEAKQLLSNTTQSILNISLMLGFSNSSHFSNAFYKLEQISPLKYRNQSRQT